MDVRDPFDPEWTPPPRANPGPPIDPPPAVPPPGIESPQAVPATFGTGGVIETNNTNNLAVVASGLRFLNAAVGLYILLAVVNFLPIEGTLAVVLGLGILAGVVAVLVLALIGMIKIQGGLRKGVLVRVLSLLSLVIPLVGLVVMVIVNTQGANALKQAGYRITKMGLQVAPPRSG